MLSMPLLAYLAKGVSDQMILCVSSSSAVGKITEQEILSFALVSGDMSPFSNTGKYSGRTGKNQLGIWANFMCNI